MTKYKKTSKRRNTVAMFQRRLVEIEPNIAVAMFQWTHIEIDPSK